MGLLLLQLFTWSQSGDCVRGEGDGDGAGSDCVDIGIRTRPWAEWESEAYRGFPLVNNLRLFNVNNNCRIVSKQHADISRVD